MRNEKGYIDWMRTEEYAHGLNTWQLFSAINDCMDTLPMADANDKVEPSIVSQGGYYRDCISVYRAEINRRELHGECSCSSR